MPWTPEMTARLDQVAARLRARALAAGVDLTCPEVQFLLGVVLGWVHEHQDDLAADPGRWPRELHWLAAAIATAGGHDTEQLVMPTVRDFWDLDSLD